MKKDISDILEKEQKAKDQKRKRKRQRERKMIWRKTKKMIKYKYTCPE